MAGLSLKHICKIYPNGFQAVRDFNLEIEEPEFVVLTGPAGCGKTTLLKVIAGLEEATSGKVLVDGQDVTDADPRDRQLAMLFKNSTLYPGMTVYENMAFGLKLRKYKKDDIDKRVREAAASLGLTEFLDRKPADLSGGQRQSITLLMATMLRPELLLLDEHTAALDPATAEKVLKLTKEIVKDRNITCLMVTHNMHQALELGNRTLMMDSGHIVFDVSGEERAKLTVDDLLEKFKDNAGKSLDNDRILLSSAEGE